MAVLESKAWVLQLFPMVCGSDLDPGTHKTVTVL